MKKIVIALSLLVAATATTFVACKKEAQQGNKTNMETPAHAKKMGGQGQQSLASFLESVDSVGILHNEGLDYYYDSLVASQNGFNDSVQMKNFAVNVTVDFFQNKNIDVSALANVDISNVTIPPNLSGQANMILNAVINAVDAYGDGFISHTQLIDICRQQKELSYGLPNYDERYKIGSSCAVAQYSMTYWKENANKYNDLINAGNPTPTPTPFGMSEDQRRVGKADLIGALGGPVVAAAASCCMAARIIWERKHAQ